MHFEQDRPGERGSALLIVFVFAAIIAIMLYKAIPDVYFEAQRAKEQLLIDRGNEYKTAIKRFVVKNQTYPVSLDQLDNFNGVRYLRRHYKDPMTGKSEWRLIHIMGPSFVLLDSKVTPMNGTPGANGQPAVAGAASGFAASGGASAFGNSGSSGSSGSTGGFGSTPSSAFGSTNSTTQNAGAQSSAFGQAPRATDPNAPPEPSAAQMYGAQRRPTMLPSTVNGGIGADPNAPTDANQPSGASVGAVEQPQSGNNPAMAGATSPNQTSPAQAGANQAAMPGADPNNPANSALNSVNSALRRQGPTVPQSSSSSSGPTISNGSIAGVASTGKGSTIKLLNKQKDYSKWEFVYNPQQDAASQMQNAIKSPNQNGQAGNSSSFGGNSSFSGPNGGFGNTPAANGSGGFGSAGGSPSSASPVPSASSSSTSNN